LVILRPFKGREKKNDQMDFDGQRDHAHDDGGTGSVSWLWDRL